MSLLHRNVLSQILAAIDPLIETGAAVINPLAGAGAKLVLSDVEKIVAGDPAVTAAAPAAAAVAVAAAPAAPAAAAPDPKAAAIAALRKQLADMQAALDALAA